MLCFAHDHITLDHLHVRAGDLDAKRLIRHIHEMQQRNALLPPSEAEAADRELGRLLREVQMLYRELKQDSMLQARPAPAGQHTA